MSRKLSGILSGAVLLLSGLLIPGAWLVANLHGPDGNMALLLPGAQLFRAALVMTGLYLVALGFMPFVNPGGRADYPDLRGRAGALLLLVLLMVVATALRLYRLDQGIWLDEILAYVNYMSLGPGRIFTTFDDPNNHLLYTLLARLSFAVFGASTGSLRLPAVLFGVACIPALYFFARQVGNRAEALFAAALFTFSYHHVWFSQNARGYTALLFFTLVSSALLIQAMRNNRLATWILYALTASLGVLTHLTMGFVLVAHFLIYLFPVLTHRTGPGFDRWMGFFGGFMLVGLLSVLSYAFVLPQMFAGGMSSGAQGTVAAWTNPVWMVLEVVRGLRISLAGGLVALLAGLVFLAGVVDFLRRAPVVPALLFIPAGLGFLVMVSINYTLFPRFFFFAMGFAVVVVIRGCVLCGNWLGNLLRLPAASTGWPGALLCACLVAVSVVSVPYAYGPKQDYQGALGLIEEQREDGDAVVTIGIANFPYNRFYRTNWGNVETLAELDAIRATRTRTWVVYTMPMHTEAAYPELFASIRRDFSEIARFPGTLNGGEVVVSRVNH